MCCKTTHTHAYTCLDKYSYSPNSEWDQQWGGQGSAQGDGGVFGIFQYRWHWRRLKNTVMFQPDFCPMECACAFHNYSEGFNTHIDCDNRKRNFRDEISKNEFNFFLPVSGVDPSGLLGVVIDEIHFTIVVSSEIPTVGQRYLSVPSSRHCIVSIKVKSQYRIH